MYNVELPIASLELNVMRLCSSLVVPKVEGSEAKHVAHYQLYSSVNKSKKEKVHSLVCTIIIM